MSKEQSLKKSGKQAGTHVVGLVRRMVHCHDAEVMEMGEIGCEGEENGWR